MGEFENTPKWGELSGNVVFLTDKKFVVMFYAPWCGHCTKAKPGYSAASEISTVPFVAVDVETNTKTKEAFGVSQFPTFYYVDGDVRNAKDISSQLSQRSRKDFEHWLSNNGLEGDAKPKSLVQKGVWGAHSGDVLFMHDEGFHDWKKANPDFLAMFYAPWCGHCKRAKPHFGSASHKVDMPFVAVDCTEAGKAICSTYRVGSYPTFLHFKNGMSK